ncbi:hypothetical protein QVD17_34121 [Tagetes erecta]|uniref:Uncharacterized protein n=1 Tax=Tagetes erecta TaxID=13708 RepID=A0AAD8NEA0_TARER|nr:hypothetical protein QVD17_34121 [Tagetes erecta]
MIKKRSHHHLRVRQFHHHGWLVPPSPEIENKNNQIGKQEPESVYEVAAGGAVADGDVSVSDIEEVYNEDGVRWPLYGGLLLVAAYSPPTIVSDVLIFRRN